MREGHDAVLWDDQGSGEGRSPPYPTDPAKDSSVRQFYDFLLSNQLDKS